MKHLYLTLGYLREQRSKLDTSISLLEALLGATNGNGASNGHGHAKTLKLAEQALAIHHERAPKADPPKRTYKTGKHWTQTAKGRKLMAKHMKRRNAEKRAAEAAEK